MNATEMLEIRDGLDTPLLYEGKAKKLYATNDVGICSATI